REKFNRKVFVSKHDHYLFQFTFLDCELSLDLAIQAQMLATAHNITYLEVPQYGDPRREAYLACHYMKDRGDPDLHSVKWYRDNNEIFRYTPGQ
ncbi:unnamed protein product, partial [Leptidea sinapis]